ncbi:MAG TPA: MFS transporter [Candidatus Binatia bacterium]|jgi:EmrB/QacA subfamily drug resistance transporter|nr:MFS transporter [Candidatus Binatia bacterium]
MTIHTDAAKLSRDRFSAPTATAPVNRAAILAIIMVSYVMIVLDISIVITGLPKIHAELGFTDAGLSWVSNAYTLTFGGFLLLGARAGDILGRRRMFVAGLVIFVASSFLIGVAHTPSWLIAARAIQGFGSAILAPSTLALLQMNFPAGPVRTRAISYYASAAGVSASIGLVLGGVLADWLSWRVGFFINVPIGLGLIVAALRNIRETDQHAGAFDLAGAITSTLGMSALVFGIVNSAATGWSDSHTVLAMLTGMILLAIFVFTEWRAKQPIMPLRLFASRERSGAYAVRMLFIGANVGFFFFSTQYMQGVLSYSPAEAGLAFLPAMIVNFLAALAAPRLLARFGIRTVLLGSMLMGLIGMVWLAHVDVGTTYLTGLALPMLLIGLGQGGALGPLTASGIAGVSAKDAGAASGLVNAAHQLGSSLGLGLQIAASVIGAGALMGKALLTHRIGNAMECAAIMVVVALLIAFVAARHPHANKGTSQ